MNFFKRIFDIGFSFLVLIFFSPLIVIISFIILVTMGSPIIFSQKRPGLKGKPFMIYKFRTMLNKKDQRGNILPDKDRLTKVGNFLRKTSLDELPEFYNVLKGDMSIVGPRPLRMKYLERYNSEQARRHEVKPGITGLAQIKGRNYLTWEDKFKFDVWYIDNWTLLLDIKIILKTVIKVLKKEGISAEGYTTMPEFKGTKEKEL